jgi:DNA modification methylase
VIDQEAMSLSRRTQDEGLRVDAQTRPMNESGLQIDGVSRLLWAARDRTRIAGFTHNFYRYPARFSPQFAAAAIECFTEVGDLVLDPYMGGATAVVEALALGRNAIGNDLNSLSTFIAKAKTTPLTGREDLAVRNWALHVVPILSYRASRNDLSAILESPKTKNLSLVRGRYIKKLVASALASLAQLPSANAQGFARCAVLRVAQWALDGRKTHTTLVKFRSKLSDTTLKMLDALEALSSARQGFETENQCLLFNEDAGHIDRLSIFAEKHARVKLVVTSPPYPGVHVLYHRWQVDGRRETPAPYWIAGCADGQGAAYYNFGDRRDREANKYFDASLRSLSAIRRVMAPGGVIVQMLAFGNPKEHLPRYLDNMDQAGFEEFGFSDERIWRDVPNRRWHATLRGQTHSAREVVLIHTAR